MTEKLILVNLKVRMLTPALKFFTIFVTRSRSGRKKCSLPILDSEFLFSDTFFVFLSFLLSFESFDAFPEVSKLSPLMGFEPTKYKATMITPAP